MLKGFSRLPALSYSSLRLLLGLYDLQEIDNGGRKQNPPYEATSGMYYKQVTIVMTVAFIIKLETIVIDDASYG